MTNGNIVALLMANALRDCHDDPIINNENTIINLAKEVEHLTHERDNLRNILRDYPKGQDDGTWIKRREAAL